MKTAADYAKEILGDCTCDEIYASRQMEAPDCVWHNYHYDVEEALKANAKEVAEAVRMDMAERSAIGENFTQLIETDISRFIK